MKIFKFLFLFWLAQSAMASPTNVNIVWGFSPSVSAFNYSRHVVHQANEDQKKYKFNLDFKPGAAGSIAARHVINETQQHKLTILMTSTAFFVRPYLYNTPGYKFDEFKLLTYQTEVPMALVMKKGRKFNEILQQSNISLSIAGNGSMTHVMAERFRRVYPNQVNLIGYNGTREAVRDVIGGNLDLAFELLGSVIEDDKVEIIGISGRQSISGIPLLADLSSNYHDFKIMGLGIFLLIPNQVPDSTIRELQEILSHAQKNSNGFKQSVEKDFGAVNYFSPKEVSITYQYQIREMKRLTSGMKKFD